MTEGYVKLHRQLMDHPIWTGERFSRGQAWVDLFMMAWHRDTRTMRGSKWVDVQRGQVLTTQKWLAQRWRWDRKTVKRYLVFLENAKMCHTATVGDRDSGYTLITICNYNKFQEPQNDVRDTATVGDRDTDAPQTPHRRPTNKNDKNIKECKEEDLAAKPLGESSFQSETISEPKTERPKDEAFETFCSEFVENREIPYRAGTGDHVQLAALRKQLGIGSRETPERWTDAVRNYFKSPLSKYTMADLCVRFDVFLQGSLDRFGKPANCGDGPRARNPHDSGPDYHPRDRSEGVSRNPRSGREYTPDQDR
jgi:hypothetical protein